MRVRLEQAVGRIWVARICFSFQRTKLDEDPAPSLGSIPVHRTVGFRRSRDEGWQQDAFLLHIPDGEAMWIGLTASTAGPKAIRVRFGDIDAISGGPWRNQLTSSPRNYVVWPGQLWVEGIYRNGRLRSRFSLGRESWLPLELSTFVPDPEQKTMGPRRAARKHPQILHGPERHIGQSPQPGVIAPDRTGVNRWTAIPEAPVLVYVTSATLYRDLTGLAPLNPVSQHDRYGGQHLP